MVQYLVMIMGFFRSWLHAFGSSSIAEECEVSRFPAAIKLMTLLNVPLYILIGGLTSKLNLLILLNSILCSVPGILLNAHDCIQSTLSIRNKVEHHPWLQHWDFRLHILLRVQAAKSAI